MESGISSLALQLQSLVNRLQFNSSPSFYLDNVFAIAIDEQERMKKHNVYLTCTVLAWTFVYIAVKSYFNKFLRQRNVSIIQRNRIINALWSWSFHLIGLFYLRFYHLSDVPSKPDNSLYPVYLLMKAFSLHFAAVKVFSCTSWMTGFSHLLFTVFIFNDFNDCFNPYVLYICCIKLVDILILEACRFLFILWKDNCGNIFSKFLFTIHCFYWVYMYFYFIPNFLFSSEKEISSSRLPYFTLWYISECIDSVWIKLFKYNRTEPWLKTYLFSTSEESALLMEIYKKHLERDDEKNSRASRIKKQIDLWKIVRCAVAVKKTLQRRRKALKEQNEQREAEADEHLSDADSPLDEDTEKKTT